MPVDFVALANAGIQKLHPYEPGKPIEELERELGITDILKLASNESPVGASPKAMAAAKEALSELHRYPDGSGHRLKAALAEKFNVWTSQITLGNGSNDILDLIARCWLKPNDEVVFSEYGFAVYPIAALSCNATPVAVPARDYGHDLEAMLEAITDKTRLIFVANPNNPTGTWLTREELDSFLERVPKRVLVVLDEAYIEYVVEECFPDGFERIPQHKNLIVARTFSKMYGLSGLRVGYAISSQEIASVLNRVRQPFNVNSIALAAAEAALEDEDHLEYSRSVNTDGLVQIAEGLQLMGLEFIPSVTNFIAFDCGRAGGPVFEALLKEGVIVRPLAGYGLPNHLRVTVGLAEENERFLNTLKKVLDV
ncbi:MAG TPA: histidinol-phosphate transaminase [Alcanivoracaceae bacterium]|nr:histidinol-phosphate transaminase [Alcanivoracaceae bacterium]